MDAAKTGSRYEVSSVGGSGGGGDGAVVGAGADIVFLFLFYQQQIFVVANAWCLDFR